MSDLEMTPAVDGSTGGLPPARAALAGAIEELHKANRLLEEAQRPVSEITRIRAAATSREASELRSAVVRMHQAHETAIMEWVALGAKGGRPVPPVELFEAEQRLGVVAADANGAEATAAAAEGGYVAAAERVRKAAAVRDAAVWTAAVDAAEPALGLLSRAVSNALTVEARLRGLILALRAAGQRDATGETAAYAAASALEARIAVVRRAPALTPEIGPGRLLIERLRSDPLATLDPAGAARG